MFLGTPPFQSMHYLYAITRNGALYIGQTSNLRKRFAEHSNKYACKLLYYEAYNDKECATKREWQLKQYGGAYRSLRKRLGI